MYNYIYSDFIFFLRVHQKKTTTTCDEFSDAFCVERNYYPLLLKCLGLGVAMRSMSADLKDRREKRGLIVMA